MKGMCFGLIGLLVAVTSAEAQPVVSLEGKWEGQCKRGTQSADSSVFVDQQGARMNGEGVQNFRKGPFSVSFEVPGRFLKKFSGTFSSDTSKLTGTLTVGDKVAQCSMNRKVATPDRVCIRNADVDTIYWRLEPGSASAMRLQKGQEDRAAGTRGGKVCWDSSDFRAPDCPRSLPQSSYAC